MSRVISIAVLLMVAAACSASTTADRVGVMTCPDGSFYEWTWFGSDDTQEPPPVCADGSAPTFIETDAYSPPTTESAPETVIVTVTVTVPVPADTTTTSTTMAPATTVSTFPPRTTTADLDGDGADETIELAGGFVSIGGSDIGLPGPRPEEWTELFVVDVIPGDDALELALLRWLGEDDHELLLVAYVQGAPTYDRPVRLFNMSSMIFDGSVLDGRIEATSTNCGITTTIDHRFGPDANVVYSSVAFADADPEPCFG